MTEKEQLNSMTDVELTAYWNILQFPGTHIGDKVERHIPIVSELLTERNIEHERGRLTRRQPREKVDL